MTRAARLIPQTFGDHGFERAASDLFLRHRQGHMDPFLYSLPLFQGDTVDGARIWDDFLRANPHYLISSQEAALIEAMGPILDRFSGNVTELVDFGAGSISGFNAKIRPLLGRLSVPVYRPVDLCRLYLNDITAALRLSDPQLIVKAENTDFLSGQVTAASGPAWLSWVGSSFSNIPTRPEERLPLQHIEQRLHIARSALPYGGKCLISIDTTNDEAALMRAYDHPLGGALTLNLLHQMARDCPNMGIDPAAWRYAPVWNPSCYVIEHRIVARRPQVIYLAEKLVYIATGESFVTDHSYKIPAVIIEKIAHSVGWKQSSVFGDKGGVQLLLLSS